MKYIEAAMKWIYDNRAWLFEGVGVAIIGWVIYRLFKNEKPKTGNGGGKSIGTNIRSRWFSKVEVKDNQIGDSNSDKPQK